jgi:hypothetical protein
MAANTLSNGEVNILAIYMGPINARRQTRSCGRTPTIIPSCLYPIVVRAALTYSKNFRSPQNYDKLCLANYNNWAGTHRISLKRGPTDLAPNYGSTGRVHRTSHRFHESDSAFNQRFDMLPPRRSVRLPRLHKGLKMFTIELCIATFLTSSLPYIVPTRPSISYF